MALGKSLGSRRQAILLGVLAAVLLLALVRWRPGASAAPPSPSPSARSGRLRLDATGDESAAPERGRRPAAKEVSPEEVPILSVKDFGAVGTHGGGDTGRDLFDLREPTHPPPPTPTPAPPVPGDARFIGPLPPPPPTPTPRPPEISFKFLGTFGPKEYPIAVIQQGDQVFNVRAGDTLFGKFVVRKVGYESIDVGFVGFAPSETRRLGITP
jgi:hypothetical protein